MKYFLLSALLLLGITSITKADEADAKAILEKSADATSRLKSLKADMVTETFASTTPQHGTYFQKKMPDGTLLMRVEMNLPAAASAEGTTSTPPSSYTLLSPQGIYTVTGNKAIRMDGMPGMDKIKDVMNSDTLKSAAQASDINYAITTGEVDGKECWVVSIPTTAAALESIRNTLSQGLPKELLAGQKIRVDAIPIPAKTVMSIDKQTYLIIKHEGIDANNKVIQSTTFQNQQSNIELPDELFKLSDHIKIETIESIIQQLPTGK